MKYTISMFLIFSLGLSTISPVYAQQSFTSRLKKGAESLARYATTKIKSGLSSALDKVRRIGPAAAVSQLQRQVENLGTKTKIIADCMLRGNKCTAAQRAAFIGTSLTVLALTVAVIGATISVAATSKEVEKITQVTTKEVQGWAPEQIFQRLSNTINNFKTQLTSLKEGILKKQLTRGQKRFLYSSALTMAALVTIALAVGVDAAISAQKKEAEPGAEISPVSELEVQKRIIEKEARAKKLSQREIDALLAELGSFDDDPTLTPEESRNPFKKYFLSKINVIEGKSCKKNIG